MKKHVGRIHRTMRGWRVNTIHVNRLRHTTVEWICRAAHRYVVVLPPFGRPLGKAAVVIPSHDGKASYKIRWTMIKKRRIAAPYMILLEDGETYRYVMGNSPPIIVLE